MVIIVLYILPVHRLFVQAKIPASICCIVPKDYLRFFPLRTSVQTVD